MAGCPEHEFPRTPRSSSPNSRTPSQIVSVDDCMCDSSGVRATIHSQTPRPQASADGLSCRSYRPLESTHLDGALDESCRKEVQAPRNDAATGRQQLHDTVQAAAMNLCRMENTKSVSKDPSLWQRPGLSPAVLD